MAVETPAAGWVILPVNSPSPTYPKNIIASSVENLTIPGTAIWRAVGQAQTEEGIITWAIAGTVASWQGTPLAMALVIEEDNPFLAIQITNQMLAEVMQ